MNVTAARRVHFVGVGGAGMSALAKVLLERGAAVSGSDLKRSRATTTLEAMGADVRIGHRAEQVDGADLVVISAAIPERNPEVARARQAGIPVLTRGEALAALLAGLRSVVVAGTHGKTTTTSMIVSILLRAGLDPTYLVGAGLNDVGTNARFGRDEIAIAESDESDGSFLHLEPFIAVVTNIEVDHVDYWSGIDALRDAFAHFLDRIPAEGAAVLPVEETALIEARRAAGTAVFSFGDGGDVVAADVWHEPAGVGFRLATPQGAADVVLQVPGVHNVTNALAAAAACLPLGLDPDVIARGLAGFRGVERRFQIRGRARGVTVIDDYAHHPTEVRATLAAARAGRWDRVVAVFQPHRYSRTTAFSDDFGGSFRDADRVIVTDVYGAGEEPVPGVTGKLIADAVCERLPGRPVAYLPH
ncbi:MAG: UDP-N-acetylmuramate--L-alanine ligase, partial [Actinomycetota bacterium]|nr:UDP-N-acetylmuramate--L-alanine ligase [Actinomycetota bacterium]